MDEQGGGVPLRLTDGVEVEPGSPEARAIELLGAAVPYQVAVGRKQRVWSALGEVPAHRPTTLLRAAVVGAVLIGGGAIGRAAVGHWPSWMLRAYQGLVRPAAAPAAAPAQRESRAGRRRGLASPVASAAAASTTAGAPEIAEIAEPAGAGGTPARHLEVAAAARSRRVAPAAPKSDGDETAPVLAAMRALRLEHNPVQARALLTAYLVHYPSGALAEEALAMSIEAAVAHHDADAGALAHRYLRLYPAGPFNALARTALATP